jgi:hypothetical protein
VLSQVSQDWLLDPRHWSALRYVGLIIPDGDHLPVRAKYAGHHHGHSIGLNPFWSETPQWYTGYDLAVSILRTGRAPRLLRAFRIVPHGVLDGLKSVLVRGLVEIDPRQMGLFARLVAERQRVKSDLSIPEAEREWLAQALKTFVNSASYGDHAELNVESLRRDHRARVRVNGIGPAYSAETSGPEKPGEFCFPPSAAFATGAARLVLQLIEREVVARGGVILAMDTDSAHIVASRNGGLIACPGGKERFRGGQPAIRALSWKDVDEVARTLECLKPYGPEVKAPFLKIEAENFIPGTKTRVQLYGLALSSKRYALFEKRPGRRIRIRRRLEHGLALYRPPAPAPSKNPDDPYPHDIGWTAEVWRRDIRKALGWAVGRSPIWFQAPAIQQLSITSPSYLTALEEAHPPTTYADGPRPFSFMVAGQLAENAMPPAGVDRTRYRLIAPYSKDPDSWARLPWVDLYSRSPCSVTTHATEGGNLAQLRTMGEVIRDHHHHPEAKCLGPDGRVCHGRTRGLLQPRPVVAASIQAIGKESHKVEEIEDGMEVDWDEAQLSYEPAGAKGFWIVVRPYLDQLTTKQSVDAFAARVGISGRTVARMRAGKAPSPRHRAAVREVIEILMDMGVTPDRLLPALFPERTARAKRGAKATRTKNTVPRTRQAAKRRGRKAPRARKSRAS